METNKHILKNRSFAFLWSGQSISIFGIAIYTTCLPFLVFHIGGDAIDLGMAHSFFIIPQVYLLLISGVFVDRWPRKTIIIICDVIRGVAVLGITVLLLMDALNLTHIYLLTSLLGILSTFYRPAVRGITPQLVNKNQLISANSLRSISQQLSNMVGPVIAGAVVVQFGLYVAYGINTATFLISALFVSFVIVQQANNDILPETNNQSSFWRDFLDGWSAIKERAWLGVSILLGSLANIGIASFDVIILPVFAKEFYEGVVTYSWILSSMAIGALFCAFIIGKIDKLIHRGILYYSFMSLSGLGVLFLSFRPTVSIVLLIVALIGFCLTAFIIIWESAVQSLVEEELLGRVTSFQMFGGLVLLPIGYQIFGVIIDKYGINTSLTMAGIGIMFVSVLGLMNKRIRELR